VLDLFGGSGSTLIAAHHAGRPAALVELLPKYGDVIARRWEEHTGVVPVLRRGSAPPQPVSLGPRIEDVEVSPPS